MTSRRCLSLISGLLGMLSLPWLATLASAETIDVYDNHGGRVADYDRRWAGLAARGGQCQDRGTMSVRLHRALGTYSTQPDLRHAGRLFRFSPCQAAERHRHTAQCLRCRHPRVDRPERRFDKRLHLAAGSGNLSLFQEVLSAHNGSAACRRDLRSNAAVTQARRRL